MWSAIYSDMKYGKLFVKYQLSTSKYRSWTVSAYIWIVDYFSALNVDDIFCYQIRNNEHLWNASDTRIDFIKDHAVLS